MYVTINVEEFSDAIIDRFHLGGMILCTEKRYISMLLQEKISVLTLICESGHFP